VLQVLEDLRKAFSVQEAGFTETQLHLHLNVDAQMAQLDPSFFAKNSYIAPKNQLVEEPGLFRNVYFLQEFWIIRAINFSGPVRATSTVTAVSGPTQYRRSYDQDMTRFDAVRISYYGYRLFLYWNRLVVDYTKR
jgi:hypothetical protein